MRFFKTIGCFLAGAALFAAVPAFAETETALLQPPAVADAVPFRAGVLSESDKAVYIQIFDKLDNGETQAAEMLLKTVENPVLKGYVQASLYLADGANPKKQQLTNWLYAYKDLPVSDAVYDLAIKKKSYLPYIRRDDKTQHMVAGVCTSMRIADPIDLVFFRRASYVPEPYRAKVRKSLQYFSSAVRRGKTLAAKLHLNEKHMKKYLSQKDRDDSETALAFAYFIDRQDEKAWETIQAPLKRSQSRNPLAPWVAGLTAFRMKKWPEAEENFKAAAAHPKAIPTQKSAAAFWATRAMMKQEKYTEISAYLKQAAFASPRSFYGILAQRALGWDIGHSWLSPSVAEPDMDAILKEKGGQRAVALIEIGQAEWAEKELVKLFAAKKNLRDDLLAYVETLPEYPELKERLAGLNGKIETPDGDSALYPVPHWTPVNGWKLDKALVYAFVRQESCFKNKAFSKAGARGVMQLMPATAKLMARKLGVKYQLSRLHKIPYSLMMGQELIKTLLNYPSIDGNLLMAIASYNCGPRNTKKWQKREDFISDPLMFVEAIPSRETRGFVKKVTSNYWVYRSLLGEDLSSVDDVLAGRYPVYKPE
ncbi:MAG TPA: hypothetical protein DD624_06850 [Alphaproteobacteria bacterium]|nr:hypothetical protein [Alphaproteobacteria bacterium]